MAKLAPPILFSKHFGVDESELVRLGVFDPTLNVDSLLFPDPLLLERSAHPEIRRARATFDKYFEQIMKLLHAIRDPGDKIWRTAFQRLSFPEVKGTCLGYGAGSIAGSGSGPQMARQLLETGRDIIRLGIDDPDLFMAMGLFEENFGPDLIGDMVTNITLGELIAFNQRITEILKIPTAPFDMRLKNGTRFQGNLIRNPTISETDVPIILVPKDILRALPVATDWREVQQVAAENEEFRSTLNESVAHLWSKKSLERKESLKRWALSTREAFGSLLDLLHGHDGKPYDFVADPHGELIWRHLGEIISQANPLKIVKPATYDSANVISIVRKILDQFRHLIEDRDLWRELYAEGKPRLEKSSQRIFYAIALSYCQANGLDISPEAETGRGPVDFKMSSGILCRVLVEVKLSTNTRLIHGFEKQLAIYETAERPVKSFFVVLNVGNLGKKQEELETLRAEQVAKCGDAPEIIIINGLPKRSASVA